MLVLLSSFLSWNICEEFINFHFVESAFYAIIKKNKEGFKYDKRSNC